MNDKEFSDKLREVTRPMEIEIAIGLQQTLRNMMTAELQLPAPDETLIDMYEVAINTVENVLRRMGG